jgi:hypothetical protein
MPKCTVLLTDRLGFVPSLRNLPDNLILPGTTVPGTDCSVPVRHARGRLCESGFVVLPKFGSLLLELEEGAFG